MCEILLNSEQEPNSEEAWHREDDYTCHKESFSLPWTSTKLTVILYDFCLTKLLTQKSNDPSTATWSCQSVRWPRAAGVPILTSIAPVQPTHTSAKIHPNPHTGIHNLKCNIKEKREREDLNSALAVWHVYIQVLLQYLVSRNWRHVGRHRRLHSHYPVSHWIGRRIVPRTQTVFQYKAQELWL